MSGTYSHPAATPAAPLADPLPVRDQSLVTLTGQHIAVTQDVVDALLAGISVTASPVEGRPRVFAGSFYVVASGSQNETDLNASGFGFIVDQFTDAELIGFGGQTVQSVTITGYNTDAGLDVNTMTNFITVDAFGLDTFLEGGESNTWSTLERWAQGSLVGFERVRVHGEAYAKVTFAVSD